MNSNDTTDYFVPFWILLEYLDQTPTDPFIKVSIANKKTSNFSSPEGLKEIICCDLLVNTCDSIDIIAYNVPYDYLIHKEELPDWAEKISQWFLNYAK